MVSPKKIEFYVKFQSDNSDELNFVYFLGGLLYSYGLLQSIDCYNCLYISTGRYINHKWCYFSTLKW